jgi:hypothetical protein
VFLLLLFLLLPYDPVVLDVVALLDCICSSGTTEQNVHSPQDPVTVPSGSIHNDKNAGDNRKINASYF